MTIQKVSVKPWICYKCIVLHIFLIISSTTVDDSKLFWTRWFGTYSTKNILVSVLLSTLKAYNDLKL